MPHNKEKMKEFMKEQVERSRSKRDQEAKNRKGKYKSSVRKIGKHPAVRMAAKATPLGQAISTTRGAAKFVAEVINNMRKDREKAKLPKPKTPKVKSPIYEKTGKPKTLR